MVDDKTVELLASCLNRIIGYANSSIITRSRDVGDWIDDMDHIIAMAESCLKKAAIQPTST